jgi:hypothetical protein
MTDTLSHLLEAAEKCSLDRWFLNRQTRSEATAPLELKSQHRPREIIKLFFVSH